MFLGPCGLVAVDVKAFADWLGSTPFRSFGIPAIALILSVITKFALRERRSSESLWETFEVGTELMISACVALPALMSETALTFQDAAQTEPNSKIDALVRDLLVGGWAGLALLVLFLAFVVYERFVGRPCRDDDDVLRALFGGVVVPTMFGIASLMLVFTFVSAA